jgi:hypothetical protein
MNGNVSFFVNIVNVSVFDKPIGKLFAFCFHPFIEQRTHLRFIYYCALLLFEYRCVLRQIDWFVHFVISYKNDSFKQ